MNNKNIRTINDKGQAHGYCECYHFDTLVYKCFYRNGSEIGYEEYYPYPTFKLEKYFYII